MAGVHRGSLVAAGTALAAALVALVFLPARPAASEDLVLIRTEAADSAAPSMTAEQRLTAGGYRGRAGSLVRPGPAASCHACFFTAMCEASEIFCASCCYLLWVRTILPVLAWEIALVRQRGR